MIKKISLGVHLPIGYKDTFPLLSVKPDPVCLLFQKQKLRCFPYSTRFFYVPSPFVMDRDFSPFLLRYKRKWRVGLNNEGSWLEVRLFH
ncbi:hypothetical protein CEXT_319561 [Caerostris extrusa]|uniref:Uncharacterized protein n=1 Tax=Caerostris extrusa TaxID=172846 RepID=A0AAV4NPZ0_CAEEX|nr:hypothetical protein CEXT_319561 [Caerostris extrusa]